MTPPRITGILPAALTLFHDDLSLDTDGTLAFYRSMLDAGCDGIVAMGTTGEANSLAFRERCALIDALGASGFGDKVIAGIGTCNLPETIELGDISKQAGLAGLLIMPPFFYRGVSDEGVYAAYAHILERLGPGALPVYIYDFPKMSGIDIALDTIAKLREAFPGRIVGLKNSSGDFEEMKAQGAAFEDFDVFAGTEEYLLPALRAGLVGCISASFNVFAADGAALMAAWQGPQADTLQARLTAKRHALAGYPMIPANKGLLGRRDGRALAVRPPLMPLSATELDALAADLAAIGKGA